jgi:hypothetical protein
MVAAAAPNATDILLPPPAATCERIQQALRLRQPAGRRNLLADPAMLDAGDVGMPDLDMLVLHLRVQDIRTPGEVTLWT